MSLRLLRQSTAVLAAGACMLTCLLGYQLSRPGEAQAGTHGFCENVVLPARNGYCLGGPVNMYQAYGWGENASVCVTAEPYSSTTRCSGGPNQGVYSGTIPPESQTAVPWIRNNAGVANRVHGIYLN
jgi:hypothetical protein